MYIFFLALIIVFLNIYIIFYYMLSIFLSLISFFKYIFPFLYICLEKLLNLITLYINSKTTKNNITNFSNYKLTLSIKSLNLRFKDFYFLFNLKNNFFFFLIFFSNFRDFYSVNLYSTNFKKKYYLFFFYFLFNFFLFLDFDFLNKYSFKLNNKNVFLNLTYNSSIKKKFYFLANSKNNFFNYLNIKNLVFKKKKYFNYISTITKNLYSSKIIILSSVKSLFNINFPITSIDNLFLINKEYNFLFLRSFKVFNKGRYSRNRQYYRTGVYWCLYINIIAVIGMYFWFYRFTMNFGYLWWLFYFFILTFFFSKFFNISSFILTEFFSIINWFGLILSNLYFIFYMYISKVLNFFFFKINYSRNFLIKDFFFYTYKYVFRF